VTSLRNASTSNEHQERVRRVTVS